MPLSVSASGVEDRYGQIVGQVLVLRDIRDQKQVEAEMEHLATHDSLTGLPNRSILHDRLQRALDRAGRDKKPFALLMFDLDEFNAINDTYGHKVGDIVLQSTAKRLDLCVRGLDTVCRVGGDEFMVVVEDLFESGDSDIVARRILHAFDEPIGAGAHAISVTASVGISTYPFDGLDPETLIKKADLALVSSKKREKGGFQFYAPRMDAINRERTRIEQGLRLALAKDELRLAYQPLVQLETGEISGVEALLALAVGRAGGDRTQQVHPGGREIRAHRSHRSMGSDHGLRDQQGLAGERPVGDTDQCQCLGQTAPAGRLRCHGGGRAARNRVGSTSGWSSS